jgi:hypothetical protein
VSHEARRISAGEIIFAACVYGDAPPYRWLVWGPRAWQREGETDSKVGAWATVEVVTRYGEQMIRRQACASE